MLGDLWDYSVGITGEDSQYSGSKTEVIVIDEDVREGFLRAEP